MSCAIRFTYSYFKFVISDIIGYILLYFPWNLFHNVDSFVSITVSSGLKEKSYDIFKTKESHLIFKTKVKFSLDMSVDISYTLYYRSTNMNRVFGLYFIEFSILSLKVRCEN